MNAMPMVVRCLERQPEKKVAWNYATPPPDNTEHWTSMPVERCECGEPKPATYGRCATCVLRAEVHRLEHPDDHETGAVRGLLHGQCNSGIGLLKDSPALLRRAAEYLESRL